MTVPSPATTRDGFARLLLAGLNLRADDTAADKLVAWMVGEDTAAAWNPLATTLAAPDDRGRFNTAGVRDYRSQPQGRAATILTLLNGLYGDVLDALADPAVTVTEFGRRVAASPWGTRTLPDTVTDDMRHHHLTGPEAADA